jgi:hypothetical protein
MSHHQLEADGNENWDHPDDESGRYSQYVEHSAVRARECMLYPILVCCAIHDGGQTGQQIPLSADCNWSRHNV